MTEWLRPNSLKRVIFFLLTDSVLSLFTLYIAYLLRFNFEIPSLFLDPFLSVAATLILLKLFFIHRFKNYTIVWRFYSLTEAKNLFMALFIVYLTLASIHLVFPILFAPFPRSVIVIDLFLSLVFLGGIRFLKRIMLGFESSSHILKPTLLIGISSDTANLIKSTLATSRDYYPIAIIAVQDKNLNMIGSHLGNIKIYGMDDLSLIIREKMISTVIIDGLLPNEYLWNIYDKLENCGIHEIKRSRFLQESINKIEDLSIEELLARHPKDLDTQTIQNFIQGKSVLITGAGGSIGSEVSLQCHRFGASSLILIDHSEYNLYQIGEKLPTAELHLCNILDYTTLDTIIQKNKPDIVIHAAAYKHVPLCEYNPHAAVMNNIIGSKNVIDSAIAHDVPKIVIISTDKAVRPTNVMGATKRVVELYAQNVNSHNSEIVAVRFGNVLGSSGSVIPKFKSQIESGGPITITHPDVERYFMLISEACQLVLQAASIARGGELFILDMGKPVKITDLANTMIKLYATKPIEIVYTGLRPGEKLYEELLMDESEQQTAFQSIMIARSSVYPIPALNTAIDSLVHAHNVPKELHKIIPEYTLLHEV